MVGMVRSGARALTGKWAWAPPVICGLHCVSAPLLVAAAPALAPTPATEWVLLAASLVIAGPVLLRGIAGHGRMLVAVPAAIGLLVWILSLSGSFAPLAEEITTAAGTLLLAFALLLNLRMQRALGSWCSSPVPGLRTSARRPPPPGEP